MENRWFPAVDSTSVVGQFVDVETVDVEASKNAKKNVHKRVPALRSKVAGSIDTSDQRVKDFNKDELIARFPGAWEHYMENRSDDEIGEAVPVVQAIKGTPIYDAGIVPRERIPFLRELGFTTVEQLRDMSDTVAQGLGRGAMTWRKKATEYLART